MEEINFINDTIYAYTQEYNYDLDDFEYFRYPIDKASGNSIPNTKLQTKIEGGMQYCPRFKIIDSTVKSGYRVNLTGNGSFFINEITKDFFNPEREFWLNSSYEIIYINKGRRWTFEFDNSGWIKQFLPFDDHYLLILEYSNQMIMKLTLKNYSTNTE